MRDHDLPRRFGLTACVLLAAASTAIANPPNWNFEGAGGWRRVPNAAAAAGSFPTIEKVGGNHVGWIGKKPFMAKGDDPSTILQSFACPGPEENVCEVTYDIDLTLAPGETARVFLENIGGGGWIHSWTNPAGNPPAIIRGTGVISVNGCDPPGVVGKRIAFILSEPPGAPGGAVLDSVMLIDNVRCACVLAGGNIVPGNGETHEGSAGELPEGWDEDAEEITGFSTSCPSDLDGDGTVSFGDLLDILSNWGPCP